MTRIFVTMPHYFGAAGTAMLDSTTMTDAVRVRRRTALVMTLQWLNVNFGTAHYRLDFGIHGERKGTIGEVLTVVTRPGRLDIEILTLADDHLLSDFALPPTVRQRHVEGDPAELPFACHDALAERRGEYDWYCYVEDDIYLTDPSFFDKQRWFNRTFGDDKLLSPNRYEFFGHTLKVYVDGEIGQPLPGNALSAGDGGRKLSFLATTNPMAGCFFLSAAQMDRWVRSPGFGRREMGSLNAGEATILKLGSDFHFYRPSLENADFLEVVHGAARLSHGSTPFGKLTRELQRMREAGPPSTE